MAEKMQKWAIEIMDADKPLREGLEELNSQSLEKQRKEERVAGLPPPEYFSLSEKGEDVHTKHRASTEHQ